MRRRMPHAGPDRMPEWMRRPLARTGQGLGVAGLLSDLRLHTVCQEAKCPNRGECFSGGTATFLVLGDLCTRSCAFCAVQTGSPPLPDPEEPRRLAEAAKRLSLRHVVITMVARDDLNDGGASHMAECVRELRASLPQARVEVLVSDLMGEAASLRTVVGAEPDVFNHNLETVPRQYASVRPEADYVRSLGVLARAKELSGGMSTKSGLMLGMGERREEVLAVLRDLRDVGCEMLTLGQYLRPSPAHHPVAEFVDPSVFAELGRAARDLGFSRVASGPYVRSSYRALELAADD